VLINGQRGYDLLVRDEGGGSNATVNPGSSYATVKVYDPVQSATPTQAGGGVMIRDSMVFLNSIWRDDRQPVGCSRS
jgi:hypothetical protein